MSRLTEADIAWLFVKSASQPLLGLASQIRALGNFGHLAAQLGATCPRTVAHEIEVRFD
jgi:hypothetical protein